MPTAAEGSGRTDLAEELAADLAAVEGWWREAGVETGFVDEPRSWLKPEESESPASVAAAAAPAAVAPDRSRQTANDRPKLGGHPARWPQTLAAFADWWLTEPSLGLAGDGRRVPPRGIGGAELMVLAAQPEADDDKRLLSGAQGRLLAAILAAVGLSEERTYVASVLPAHVGLIDWVMLGERGMADVLAHHLRLAAPQRLLVLGREGAAALLGHDPADLGLASAHFIDAERRLPIAYAPDLAGLLERPARKAAVWRLLLDWGV